MASMPAGTPRPKRPSPRCGPLVPFAVAYKGRIAAALVALVVASAATLVMPMALRRVVDFGFSGRGRGLIDAYFAVLLWSSAFSRPRARPASISSSRWASGWWRIFARRCSGI